MAVNWFHSKVSPLSTQNTQIRRANGPTSSTISHRAQSIPMAANKFERFSIYVMAFSTLYTSHCWTPKPGPFYRCCCDRRVRVGFVCAAKIPCTSHWSNQTILRIAKTFACWSKASKLPWTFRISRPCSDSVRVYTKSRFRHANTCHLCRTSIGNVRCVNSRLPSTIPPVRARWDPAMMKEPSSILVSASMVCITPIYLNNFRHPSELQIVYRFNIYADVLDAVPQSLCVRMHQAHHRFVIVHIIVLTFLNVCMLSK